MFSLWVVPPIDILMGTDLRENADEAQVIFLLLSCKALFLVIFCIYAVLHLYYRIFY
jgi:hypothetical protein